MVSHKELNDIVAQINKHFDSIFSRLEILENDIKKQKSRSKTKKTRAKILQPSKEDS